VWSTLSSGVDAERAAPLDEEEKRRPRRRESATGRANARRVCRTPDAAAPFITVIVAAGAQDCTPALTGEGWRTEGKSRSDEPAIDLS